MGSVLLPFISEGAYGILTRDANPLTFAAMDGERVPHGVVSPVKSINRAEALDLVDDPGSRYYALCVCLSLSYCPFGV